MEPNGQDKSPRPQIIPDVEIVLDRLRHIRFDMPACFDAEGIYELKTGKELSFYGLATSDKYRAICCALWAGLKHEDPSLSLNDVMAMIRPNDINRVSKVILKAAFDHTVDPEAEKDPDADKKKESLSQDASGGNESGPLPG
jgi:hypothetical protein